MMPGMEDNPKVDFMLSGGGEPPSVEEAGSRAEAEPGEYQPSERPTEDLGVLDEHDRREREERDRADRRARSEPVRAGKRRDQGGDGEDSAEWRAELARRDAQLQELTAWAQQQELQRQAEQAQRQQQQQQPPDYDEDPAEYLRWQNEQLGRQLHDIRSWAQQRQQQEWQAQQEAQLAQQVQSDESRFRREAPDYDDAVNFLKQNRDRELKTWGIRDRAQRENTIQQEIMFLVQSALNQGVSPAQAAYDTAQRHGYGRHTDDYRRAERFDRELRDTRRQKRPAKAGRRDVSLEQLADLDGESFDRAWAKMFGSRIS
jgi:hypothetical protein